MKTLSLDLSTTATGYAIGQPGGISSQIGTILRPKRKDMEEGEMYMFFIEEICRLVTVNRIELVIAEQLNVSVNMQTTRVLAGLRGAVVYQLKKMYDLDVLFFEPSKFRKTAGLDLTGLPRNKGARRQEIKHRTMELTKKMGISPEDDNQADAALLLKAARELLEY